MGARASQQAKAPVVEAVAEPVVPAKSTVAAALAIDAAEALVEEDSVATTAGDEGAYQEALARCAELRITRQELLQAKMEVRATITQFYPAFEDSEESQSSDSCEDDDADQDGEDHESCSRADSQAQASSGSLAEVLAEQEELEDEVDMLRETLDAARSMIAVIVEKSQQLSEHLEEVVEEAESQQLSKNTQSSRSEQMSANATSYSKTQQEDLKLPPLHFTTACAPGSGASSSTATPRSEKSSESRTASARRNEFACMAEKLLATETALQKPVWCGA